MDVFYDSTADSYVVELSSEPFNCTVRIDDANLVDLDAAGNVIAIEILEPKAARLEMIATRFGLTNRLDEILTAIQATVPISLPETRGTFFATVEPRIQYARRQVALNKSRETRHRPLVKELTLTKS